MTLDEKRTGDLIEALLFAQISNVDPEDHETIMNRWRFLISDAFGKAQGELRQVCIEYSREIDSLKLELSELRRDIRGLADS